MPDDLRTALRRLNDAAHEALAAAIEEDIAGMPFILRRLANQTDDLVDWGGGSSGSRQPYSPHGGRDRAECGGETLSDATKFPPAFCLHESGHSLSVSRDGAIFYEDLIYHADFRGGVNMVEAHRADVCDAARLRAFAAHVEQITATGDGLSPDDTVALHLMARDVLKEQKP